MFSTREHRAVNYTSYEGAMASITGSLISTFLTSFGLFLGYDRLIIGTLIAVQILAWTMFQIPAAYIVQRSGRRKEISIIFSLVGRSAWIFVGLAPVLFGGSMAMIMLFAVVANVGAAFVGPAWASWIGDVVKPGTRSRYFSRRNALAAASALVAVLSAGIVLELTPAGGFFFIFGLAAAAGVIATLLFIATPNYRTIRIRTSPLRQIRHIISDKTFKHFCIAFSIWQFGFLAWDTYSEMYIIQNLHANYIWLAIAFISAAAGAFASLKFWGIVSEKYNHRAVMIFSCAGTVVSPLLWIAFVNTTWVIIPIEFFSGVMLAGFNMASFNYMIESSDYDRRPYYTAVFWTAAGLGGVSGTFLSGVVSSIDVTLLGVTGLGLSLLLSFGTKAVGFAMLSKYVSDVPDKKHWVKYVAGDFARVSGSFMKSPLMPLKKYAENMQASRKEKNEKSPSEGSS